MSKNRMAVVAADKKVSIGYKNQLEGIFDKDLEISLLNLEDNPELFLGFDLILAASSAILEDVKKKAPLNAKIITVIRNINALELYKIFNIEPGNTALVVSNYFYAAKETVALLTELGLNHIKYIPYSPNCGLSKSVLSSANLAITAGASSFVPKGIDRIIDLGIKVIDISTVVEIIISLGLPLERVNLFTLRYMKEFIALNRKIGDLQSRLLAVLDASTDGMMALDINGDIIFKNKNLDIFLSTQRPIEVGENISEYMKKNHMLDFITSFDDRKSDVFKINKNDVMVTKDYLRIEGKLTGTVVSFSYVSKIQSMEKEIRKKLNTKGNMAKYDFNDIIGCSKSIKTATDMTRKAAKTDLSVLLLGENGTGKELFAQAIHRNSARSNGQFVAVNFAALPENLIESELFGYEEGAFTGAKKGGKLGLFELAHMGTIFLDEIGDAPLSLQARLLRVIQEKEVLRVGGVSPIPVNVKIVAATNKNLKKMIKANQFRKDLYYRLNTITIKIPSLRERKEDIPFIIDYYMKNLNAKKKFTKTAMKKLINYSWPGNVRELENMIHYAVEIVDGDLVDVSDLPVDIYDSEEEIEGIPDYNDSLIDIIGKHGNVRIFAAVLEELEIADKKFVRASRAYVVDNVSKKGIPLTDNVLRRVLQKLQEMQCVNIGSTRQGMSITPKGKVILEKIRSVLEE